MGPIMLDHHQISEDGFDEIESMLAGSMQPLSR